MNSVVLEDVHKSFRKSDIFGFGRSVETRALKGVSLSAAPGDVLGLLGPNGSGKSTTLKLISTVLLPDRGHIRVNERDTRTDGASVRRRVAWALASERSFFGRLTARENLEFFAAFEDVPRREWRERAMAALHDVGLRDAHCKQVMKFSSGMYQRLAIARALVKRPSVLLLDEPTRSLDPDGANRLWALVRDLASTGITIVLATHNFAEAAATCDKIAILLKGELIASRQTSDFRGDQLRSFYFETTCPAPADSWRESVPA
jgi:ABC-2 type transport system ATP-binding protein